MKKYTRKELKQLIENGEAIDVTTATNKNAIPEKYEIVGVVPSSAYNTGLLMKGTETGTLYAVTDRTSAIFIFS